MRAMPMPRACRCRLSSRFFLSVSSKSSVSLARAYCPAYVTRSPSEISWSLSDARMLLQSERALPVSVG